MSTVLRIVATVSILMLGGCAALGDRYERPELTLIGFQPIESSNLEQRFLLRFRLLNPNPVSLPVRGVRYKVQLLGETFASGASSEDFDVEAFGEAEFDVTVGVSLLRAARVIMAALDNGRDRFEYRLDARIASTIPFLNDVRIVQEGEVAALHR